MSVEFVFRILGMVVFSSIGGYWGAELGRISNQEDGLYIVVLGLVGALVGLVLTPFLTTRPIAQLRKSLARTSAQTLFAGLTGLVVGLIIAALVSLPISLLPSPYGEVLPFIGAILFSYFGVTLFVMRQSDLLGMLRGTVGARGDNADVGTWKNRSPILIDTSVLIDGRIGDIARTNFLFGTLLIPTFVLTELQHIADSADSLKRQRGRRGLEIVTEMQEDSRIAVQISDIDVEDSNAVDDKLVILGRQLNAPVLTNDFNLNRVADIQGVTILNINDLANAVKAIFLPGENLSIQIIQEGKEYGQGVGYLEDGTMVVVDQGNDHIGKEVNTVVTKVLQTAAGRMIFAKVL
jgi:uncharacterized protein YacL